jgi:hypothetical protein
VIVTVLVAMQAVLPLQRRWTSRRCVMGSSGDAACVRGDVWAKMVLMLMLCEKKALKEIRCFETFKADMRTERKPT